MLHHQQGIANQLGPDTETRLTGGRLQSIIGQVGLYLSTAQGLLPRDKPVQRLTQTAGMKTRFSTVTMIYYCCSVHGQAPML
jgi:hypothetical protein